MCCDTARQFSDELPSIDLSLYNRGRPLTPAAMRLKEILTDTIPAGLSEFRRPSHSVRLAGSGASRDSLPLRDR
jgi:hypothetical protein